MNDQPPKPPEQPPPTPPAQPPPAVPPAQTPPPAASQPPPGPEKAGGGTRALAVILAIILGFGAAVMIVVGIDINDIASCDNPEEVIASGETECFDGSEDIKPVVVGLAIASGVIGALGFLAGIAFAITGTRGRLFAQLGAAAVVLGALALIIG
jgi:hypothetical protein